jgi:protein TonB
MGLARVSGRAPAPGRAPHPLFEDLAVHAARRGGAYATPFSLLAHAAGLTLLVVLPVSRVTPPATKPDPLYVPLHGLPVALPSLPRGDAGATRAKPVRSPEPPAFTAPVDAPPVAPAPVDLAVTSAADPSPATGSPLGADSGTLDGSEAGKVGGQAGGVAWGDPRGIVDGTGDVVVARPDQPPRLLQRVQPVYPQDAFARRIQGVVRLQILIDARGRVARATVVASIPDLDEAAKAAVRQWVFSPAVKDGRPVATLALAPVHFQIL